MASPHIQANFGDVLDPRFQTIFWEKYRQLPDRVPEMYSNPGDNGRDTMRWSSVGAVQDLIQFTGNINYGSFNQGYDVVATWVEYARGVQAERILLENAQYNILDARPKGLATAAFRTRQTHAAQLFESAFTNLQTWYVNSEGVSLCNNSHTTTSGASTGTGFDNLGTAALAATAVAAARIAMRDFRGDRAERISIMPTELWVPPDLYEEAYEIVASAGKVDTDLNNANVHQGKYTVHEIEYMDDANNWFMADEQLRRESVFWWDRIPLEFAFIEDFDTMLGKWRAYMGYAPVWVDWRWCYGHNVS
jgi:hypothetical protein